MWLTKVTSSNVIDLALLLRTLIDVAATISFETSSSSLSSRILFLNHRHYHLVFYFSTSNVASAPPSSASIVVFTIQAFHL